MPPSPHLAQVFALVGVFVKFALVLGAFFLSKKGKNHENENEDKANPVTGGVRFPTDSLTMSG